MAGFERMTMKHDMIDRKENWGGAAAIATLLLGAAAKGLIIISFASAATGCANKRFYIGMDDYGETSKMTHNFKTKREEAKR